MKIKYFFDPEIPGRIPLNRGDIVEKYRDRNYLLIISVGSLYEWLRDLMNVERIYSIP